MKIYKLDYWSSSKLHGAGVIFTKWLNLAGRNYDQRHSMSVMLFNEFIEGEHEDWPEALHDFHLNLEADYPKIMQKGERSVPLSHLMWGRVYLVACYCMRDDEYWVKTLLPLMEQMETDDIVREDMLFIKRKVIEQFGQHSLLAEQNKRKTIKLGYMMNDEQVKIEKFSLMTQYACVRMTPFMDFKDGTKGSVLLLGYNKDDSLVMLFNSPERANEYEHCNDNMLFPSEVDLFYAYRKTCMETNYSQYCISKERYDTFGCVVLADKFINAVIADIVCASLNSQKQANGYITNWNINRTSNMFSDALPKCKISDIEDEIKDFMSDNGTWRRSILLESMDLLHSKEFFLKNITFDWKSIRNKYAEWLFNNDFKLQLSFAEQLLHAYKEDPKRDWRRMLEEMMRDTNGVSKSFRFSNYNIQEIIGLYALSKHYYKDKPDTMDICYAHVGAEERIRIFQDYFKKFSYEMLEELKAEDNPLQTSLPTLKDADARARERMNHMRGRQPEGLTAEQQDYYTKYEQAFLSSLLEKGTTETPHSEGTSYIEKQFNNCTIHHYYNAQPPSSVVSNDNADSSFIPQKPGRKPQPLFTNEDGTENKERTKKEKERLRTYISDHKYGNHKLNTKKDNELLNIVVCFYRKWLQNNYVQTIEKATSLTRFLIETCEIPYEVDKVSIANRLLGMLKSGKYNQETAGKVSEYF